MPSPLQQVVEYAMNQNADRYANMSDIRGQSLADLMDSKKGYLDKYMDPSVVSNWANIPVAQRQQYARQALGDASRDDDDAAGERFMQTAIPASLAVMGGFAAAPYLSGALGGGGGGALSSIMPGAGSGAAGEVSNWLNTATKGLELFGGSKGKSIADVVNVFSGSGDEGGSKFGNFLNLFKKDDGSPAWGRIAGGSLGALALLSGMNRKNPTATAPSLPPGWDQGAVPLTMTRTRNPSPIDYANYGKLGKGQEGEHRFFSDAQFHAGGGGVYGPGTGRSDDIDAKLSNGEYVMDAETVALLGDGSTEAGAQRLDELRQNLRKHKGSALAKGKFSPDAKHPAAYMAKGGKLTAIVKDLPAPKAPKREYDALRELAEASRIEKLQRQTGGYDPYNRPPPRKAKGGRIRGDWVRRIINGEGSSPKAPEVDALRQQKLEALQRMIEGLKEQQTPVEDPKKPQLRIVKARGGLVESRARLDTIKALAKSVPVRKAEGGAVRELGLFADRLEEALKIGNQDHLAQLDAEADALPPRFEAEYAKGGVVKEQLVPILEKLKNAKRSPQDLRSVAEELRKLNPNSDALRQYDFASRTRTGTDKE